MGLFTHRKTVMAVYYFYTPPSIGMSALLNLISNNLDRHNSKDSYARLKDHNGKWVLHTTNHIGGKKFITLTRQHICELTLLPKEVRVTYLVGLFDENND